ncbi:MAG: hypothetical protein HZA54_15545 [Planctomycetes bacterium]|nr:hypothetical protein [Planctomycetota bacterium]
MRCDSVTRRKVSRVGRGGLSILVCLAGLLALPAFAGGPRPCSMSHVITGLWCETCKYAPGPGDLDRKDLCKKCGQAPASRSICVGRGYVCSGCKYQTHKNTRCPECKGSTWTRIETKAKVVYKCPKCSAAGDTAFTCTKCAREARPVCTTSGTFPHNAGRQGDK